MKKRVIFAGLLLLAWASGAQAASYSQVVRPTSSRIPGLTLDEGAIEVERGEASIPPRARLRGRLDGKNWTLVASGTSTLDTLVPLTGPSTAYAVQAVDPRGNAWSEKVEIKVSEGDWESLGRAPLWGLTTGVYAAVISFTQAGQPDYSEKALGARLDWQRPLGRGRRFEWGLGGYFTALPLAKDPSIDALFAGGHLRIGYRVPGAWGRWVPKLWGGLYYQTMFVTQDRFGFQNMRGPLVAVSLARSFASGREVEGHFKYAPLVGGDSVFSFVQRELALGASFVWRLRNTHPLVFSLDWSQISVEPQGFAMQCSAFSLGAAYGF